MKHQNKKKSKIKKIEQLNFRYLNIRNFEIPKYWSFYLRSFRTSTPARNKIESFLVGEVVETHKPTEASRTNLRIIELQERLLLYRDEVIAVGKSHWNLLSMGNRVCEYGPHCRRLHLAVSVMTGALPMSYKARVNKGEPACPHRGRCSYSCARKKGGTVCQVQVLLPQNELNDRQVLHP